MFQLWMHILYSFTYSQIDILWFPCADLRSSSVPLYHFLLLLPNDKRNLGTFSLAPFQLISTFIETSVRHRLTQLPSSHTTYSPNKSVFESSLPVIIHHRPHNPGSSIPRTENQTPKIYKLIGRDPVAYLHSGAVSKTHSQIPLSFSKVHHPFDHRLCCTSTSGDIPDFLRILIQVYKIHVSFIKSTYPRADLDFLALSKYKVYISDVSVEISMSPIFPRPWTRHSS